MTLDLPKPVHRELKMFGVERDIRTSAPLLRALIIEMLTDDKLADRIVKRVGGEA